MKSNMLLVVVVLAAVTISGCNTMRGAGKDVEKAGQGVQNIVDKND